MNKLDFDISKLSEYREDNCLEVKKATKGLSNSIWETYSSFANSEGGLILLGIEEDKKYQLFSLIGIGERAGSGIPSIISVWSDATGVVPTYQQFFAPDRVQFVIDVNGTTADKPLKSDVAVPLSGELSGKTSEKTTEKITEKTTEKTTEKILCIIKNNPYVTYRELAEALAMTEDGIYWSVKQLRKQGLLHRIGGRKEGYWQVQTQ